MNLAIATTEKKRRAVRMPNRHIRDLDESPDRPRRSRNELVLEHYRTIGETLNTAEAGCMRAGVPLLPPTGKVRRLAAQYKGPLQEFVHLCLVTVNTSTLELYCDDLESSAPDVDIDDSLFIRCLSFWERFGACLLLAPLIGMLAGLGALSFDVSQVHAVLSGAVAAALFGSVIAALSLEPQRRYSLHSLLYRELMRRKGLDQPNSNRVPIRPVETKPLS